jgi:hypothetical protein
MENNKIDLLKNKYDRQTLKDNIYAVKMIDILKTQKIDTTFAIRYILNEKYQLCDEDMKITGDVVLAYQPHISKSELIWELDNYDTDDDSVDDFETVSKR